MSAETETPSTRCTARNARGEPCGAPHKRGSLWCFMHDPDRAPRARQFAARSRGGTTRGRQRTAARLSRDIERALSGSPPRRPWWEDDE